MKSEFKLAELDQDQVEEIKKFEGRFGNDICIVAIERPLTSMFILEGKTSRNVWEKTQRLYPQISIPSCYSTKEEASAAKAALKGQLLGKWQSRVKKVPIRIREIE